MNIEFSVALDSPAQQRDFEFQAGDDFKLTMTVYATDTSDDIDPVDLTSDVLTFEMPGYLASVMSAVGNVFTFDTPLPSQVYYCRRAPYRIVMTDSDGLRTTLCFGHMIARPGCVYPGAWPYGLMGNDYGWI